MMGMRTNPSAVADRELLIERAVAALSGDFLQRQLPRALGIQVQVAEGEGLGDEDAAFLADMLDTLACAGALFGHHRDIEALHRCALSLHDDIMREAVADTSRRPVAAG
jgi:hypothetical protein